jgi:hypothetical protein
MKAKEREIEEERGCKKRTGKQNKKMQEKKDKREA